MRSDCGKAGRFHAEDEEDEKFARSRRGVMNRGREIEQAEGEEEERYTENR